MVSGSLLSEAEKSLLAKVAAEPQSIGSLPTAEATLLIDRNMMEEVMGHYVITPKGQLELHRHIYRRFSSREARRGQAEGGLGRRPGAFSSAQSATLRSFWTWLRGAGGGPGDETR